jgi:GT2 family glycosyltransferase
VHDSEFQRLPPPTDLLSIIVCTYRRAHALRNLLESLSTQTCPDFEVVVVDASGDAPALDFPRIRLRVLQSAKSVPVQRNAGIRAAKGELVGFLDDDVTVPAGFIEHVKAILQRQELRDAGGITGYDVLNYGSPVSMRFRVRRALGYYPNPNPGALGLCDATVPLSFQAPFSGYRNVSWLPGFCMVYRREAIDGIWFDERLTAYGAEDALFSMAVARRCRLVMCGELHVSHHKDPASRISTAEVIYGGSFALSRNYLLRVEGVARYASLAWYALVEFLLDSIDFIRRPSAMQLRAVRARQTGLLTGALSTRTN